MKVKKITLGQIPQLVAIFKNMPSVLGDVTKMDNATIIARLPELIETALPELAKLIALVTDLKEEEVLSLGLDEFTDIVVQVLEVNNVEDILKNVKKAFALRAARS